MWNTKAESRVAYLEVGEEFHDAFGCRDAAQRFPSLRRPEIPLPFVSAILAEALRNCALYADLVVKPSNSREPQPQHLAPEGLLGTLDGSRDSTLGESLSAVMERVEQWSAPAGAVDDASVLAVERRG